MKKAIINQNYCDKSPFCGARGACPVGAINAVPDESYGTRIEIDQEKCIGCAKCVMYCPHGAINMVG